MTQRQRRSQRARGGAGGKIAFLICAIVGVCALALAGTGSWVLGIASDAPDPDTLDPLTKGRNSVLYAGDGSRLGYIRSDYIREPIGARQMPRILRNAAVAIEDQRFYEHAGVDPEGATRALIQNITAQEVLEGGSTITMQLIRNLFIADPQQDIDRKIREATMAMDYEETHSKHEILTQYLNTAAFGTMDGNTSIGVEAASKQYFSKPAQQLTLPQAALLAGLPQAPTDYNPILNPRGAKVRRNEVLTRMAEQGYITEERSRLARSKGLQLDPTSRYTTIREPLFFDHVESDLIKQYGVTTVRQGGLDVHTTIDPALQDAGRAAIESHLYLEEDPSSAIVAIDPRDGEIKAMVTSAAYDENKYNLAAQGRRQPGSTFKTFVLATAIKQRIDPDSTYYTSKPLDLDLPEYGEWEVTTYGNSYSGSMSIRAATLASDNTVYAQLALDVGPEEVSHTAERMGIETELDGFPAESLGGLRLGVSPVEMASAYATLAAGGVHRPPVAIDRVVFPSGRVDRPRTGEPRRVMSEAEAGVVTSILNQNMTGGTGTAAYTGCSGQAGKTGTTDNFTDAWFVGYQPNIAISVWVGHPESNEIQMTSVHGESVAGGTFPARIWNSFYNNAGLECESPTAVAEPEWTSFSSGYTSSGGSDDGDGGGDDDFGDLGEIEEDLEGAFEEDGGGGSGEQGADDGYSPEAYAPGVGQEPTQSGQAPPPAANGGGGGGASDDGGFSPTG